eukprot:977472-Pelagomonas_calceolata.AAC.11
MLRNPSPVAADLVARSCAILAKQPRLLRVPPAVLQQQLHMLQLSLQLHSKAIGAVVQRQPGLLFEQPSQVRMRVEQLAVELEVPVPRLLRCVCVFVCVLACVCVFARMRACVFVRARGAAGGGAGGAEAAGVRLWAIGESDHNIILQTPRISTPDFIRVAVEEPWPCMISYCALQCKWLQGSSKGALAVCGLSFAGAAKAGHVDSGLAPGEAGAVRPGAAAPTAPDHVLGVRQG